MARTLDSLHGGFPVTLVFSKASGVTANTTNILTLPGGNGFVVPDEYNFHPLLLSAVSTYNRYDDLNGNSGFETAGTGGADVFGSWTEAAGNGTIAAETGATNIQSGAKSAKLTTGADGLVKLTQDVSVKPGVSYCLQACFKADGTNIPRWGVYDKTNGDDIVELGAIKESVLEEPAFEFYSVGFTAPENCETITITLAGAATEGAVVYFDEAKVYVAGAPETATAEFYILVDQRLGTLLHYNEGAVASTTSYITNDEDDMAFNYQPVPKGSEIKIAMKTTSLFAETSDTVDVVLLGVLVHE